MNNLKSMKHGFLVIGNDPDDGSPFNLGREDTIKNAVNTYRFALRSASADFLRRSNLRIVELVERPIDPSLYKE